MAGLASQLRLEAALGGHETPHHLKHVDRNPDRPRLVRDPAREGLPDPPPGVGAEVNAALDVESIDRGDQPEVSFLDEIEELDAAIPIAARERDDEAEVGVDDRAPGSLRAAPHRLPEGALLLALEERIALNLVQVSAFEASQRAAGRLGGRDVPHPASLGELDGLPSRLGQEEVERAGLEVR